MPALRVFLSSTMRDLDTERRLLRKRIAELNFEPVNAEDLAPTGARSWERIERELESCNVMVLLQGASYGWVPKSGPHAGKGKSITHLEYLKAREFDLPILAFQKVLDYDVDGKAPDAAPRDAFRKEVGDWADGKFFAKWEHGDELPGLVVKALVTMLSDEFQRARIAARKPIVIDLELVDATASLTSSTTDRASVLIPRGLIEAVESKRALLFAGAGISMAAGLPSHALFAARANQLISERDPTHVGDGSSFARLADLLDGLGGHDQLLQLVQSLIEPPSQTQPTRAHTIAVRLFPRIVTSNYDELFERALATHDPARPRITRDLEADALPERVLVKLHGTVGDPATLLLAERETAMLDRRRPRIWNALVGELGRNTTVVVGSSLRDVSIVRLFAEVGAKLSGYLVSPRVTRAERSVLAQIGLDAIEGDADSFFEALEAEVDTQHPR